MNEEVKRKLVHLTGLSVPLVYAAFGRHVTVVFLMFFLLVFSVFDLLRVRAPHLLPGWFSRFVGEIARDYEHYSPGAETYFTIGSIITVALFPPEVAVSSILVAVLADAAAAIVGRTYGRHKLLFGKSIEGSLSYFLVAAAVLSVFYSLPVAFVVAAASAVIELFDLPPDDNFSNQVWTAVVLFLVTNAVG